MVMGQSMHTTEVCVIGAGPGGYVAAIRAAQLGYDVTLIDKAGELGGLCLHHGCIPSKALIHAMNLYHEAKVAQSIGITFSDAQLELPKTMAWKQGVIDQLAKGIQYLCDKHSITVIKAQAQFQNPNQVVLQGEGLETNGVEFRYAIIATGSTPRELPWAAFGGRILSSREVLQLQEVPKKFCVVGGGYIGIELGVMLQKAGSEVTIIEGGERILGVVEPELADVASQRIKELGVTLRTSAKVETIEERDEQVFVKARGEEEGFDQVLVAIGHVPVTQGLQLELAGVALNERGFVEVDEQCRTNVSHIYAVGDVTGGVMLAHKASAQGRVAAEAIADLPSAFEPAAIPAVIFSDPEIASVGLREEEARELYDDIKTGTFPYSALGRALAIQQSEGFVKIISDSQGVILGVHGVGPGITDYIAEMSLALEMGALAEDVARTIHPHPTLSESFSEVAEALMGEAIHLYQPKKS